MAEPPYREGPPEESAELQRLVAEGQRRIQQDQQSHAVVVREAGEDNLREALGGGYFTPLKKVGIVMAGVGVLLALVPSLMSGPVSMLPSILQIVGLFLALGSIAVLSIGGGGQASDANVAAERAWETAHPFPVDGYFDVLRGDPEPECVLVVVLEWRDPARAPSDGVLRGVLGVHDTAIRIDTNARDHARFRSGVISGDIGVRVNRVSVFKNVRIPPYVHGLVDRALAPLHRSHPIARVSLQRVP
jgi:hypothetical protein